MRDPKPLEVAAWYAAKMGWSVIPIHTVEFGVCTCSHDNCPAPGKHPLAAALPDGSWKPYQTQAASVKQVFDWWTAHPGANIGVCTGAVSGIFVLDVDGQEGRDSLKELTTRHDSLPDTTQSLTGGGGLHLFFKHPGRPIRNKVSLASGLDLRGDGGYAVLPRSVHVSGRRYEWELSSMPNEVKPAEAPKWLLDMLLERPEVKATVPLRAPDEAWVKLILDGAKEGERNSQTTRLAGHLLRHNLSVPVAAALVAIWNRQNETPLPEDEVLKTVSSIAQAESRRRGCSP